jgi:hypothetical protein
LEVFFHFGNGTNQSDLIDSFKRSNNEN